jgi:hypothetical protein
MGRFLVNDGLGFEFPELDRSGNRIVAPFGGFGKWGRTSTPHKGWYYGKDTPIREPSEGTALCQMCEKARIIKIHTLHHPDFDRPLFVGADCAGRMIGDPALAKDMEKAASICAEWRPGKNAKLKTRTWGFLMAVKLVGRGYMGMFKHVPSGFRRQSREIYQTIDEAAFRTVLAMLKARRLKPWRESAA